MAALMNGCKTTLGRLISRNIVQSRSLSATQIKLSSQSQEEIEAAKVTHTGQTWDSEDFRNARFIGKTKLVTEKFAIDMIAEDPVVVCTQRVVSSDSGGALGHPKVYINVDKPGVHSCGYSGRKFVHKKYYNKTTMGPSITYEEYLEEIQAGDREYQNYP